MHHPSAHMVVQIRFQIAQCVASDRSFRGGIQTFAYHICHVHAKDLFRNPVWLPRVAGQRANHDVRKRIIGDEKAIEQKMSAPNEPVAHMTAPILGVVDLAVKAVLG